MELRQLYYFQVVAETLNITKASKRLYITQPALSTAISRLERDIGVELFDRTGNCIQLTEAGRCFLEHVNSAFSLLEEGRSQARQIESRSSQCLRIASAFGMMRDLVEEYCSLHPEHQMELTICDTDQILSMLSRGETDLALNLGTIQDSRLNNRVLMRSRYFVAFPSDHPFCRKNSITLRELDGALLFCSRIAQTYEVGTAIFQKAGCTCNLLRLDEKDVLFEAARKGLGGVFCMPMLSDDNKLLGPGDITFIPIHDCLEEGQVVLVSRKDWYQTEKAQMFVSFLERRFYQIEQSTRAELARRGEELGGSGLK